MKYILLISIAVLISSCHSSEKKIEQAKIEAITINATQAHLSSRFDSLITLQDSVRDKISSNNEKEIIFLKAEISSVLSMYNPADSELKMADAKINTLDSILKNQNKRP